MSKKTALICALLCGLSASAFAAQTLTLTLDAASAGMGKFAAEEIHREADDANATRIALTVGKEDDAFAQSFSIRVQNEGGRRVITVRGADAAGTMYGRLDIAEAIRTGTLDALRDSDQKPHIAKRGIKFNIPLALRTPSCTDCADAAQANIRDAHYVPALYNRAGSEKGFRN